MSVLEQSSHPEVSLVAVYESAATSWREAYSQAGVRGLPETRFGG